MKQKYENRAIAFARYITQNNATVRKCAKEFSISKSTVHSDITKKLPLIDRQLYLKVRIILDNNKNERHIRGGIATKIKYSKSSDDKTKL